MTKKLPNISPGAGERRAQRGYIIGQYEPSAAAIYAALDRNELLWVGLADRTAGIADDLVLGFAGRVIGHQFKMSRYPKTFRMATLLMGKNGFLPLLANAWKLLNAMHPSEAIEIRLVTNDYPSTNDNVGNNSADHSAAFLAEFEQHSERGLAEWRTTRWQPFIDSMFNASCLSEKDFEQFLLGFRLLHGSAADFVQLHRLSKEGTRLAQEIATLLPRLVADLRDKDRWSREELLKELGWRDSRVTRHTHIFPVGDYVQRNVETEDALLHAIRGSVKGYVALVGSPGAGKSTLLQSVLATETGLRVVRYLAYVPGIGQGIGRGEADDFLDDIATQLKNSGLQGVRFRNQTRSERMEHFAALLRQAGDRYQQDRIKTLIVVDGLDHVPREEKPQHSFLAELPLPESIPDGVLFVLGTQRLDLDDLKPSVQDQADAAGRKVVVSPLKREAVHRMADQLELDIAIPRDRVFELSHGHPLVTRYLIEALREADETGRTAILAGTIMKFEGDINTIYESAWRGIRDDDQARKVLDYIARAEGPMPLELLAREVLESDIERTLKAAQHLLVNSSQGCSIFHNSFRLFIIGKPRLRLGEEDTGYSAQIYHTLAKLAQSAPNDTPQHWLELRYLARAQDHAAVLALAQPTRFREQFAQRRPFRELQGDIRLAFAAAATTHDATVVMRLLLAYDEIIQRSTAMEYAPNLTKALLSIGELDAAQAFAEEYGHKGFEVVDALLAAGENSRAKELFEKLEPLQQLLTGRLEHYEIIHNPKQYIEWASRVIHFRDLEQINKEIDRLCDTKLDPRGRNRKELLKQLAENLRYQVVLAILDIHPDRNMEELLRALNLRADLLPNLLVHSGLKAHKQGAHAQAMALFQRAIGHKRFPAVPNAWRRRMALIAASTGEIELAQTLFDDLIVPAISSLDDKIDDGSPDHLTHAVVEHAQLSALLGRPAVAVVPSKSRILRPLQLFASAVGTLLGKAQNDSSSIARGDVARLTARALSFLTRVTPKEGDEFFAITQAVKAASVLGRALIQIAELCGEEEFALVLAEFDHAFSVTSESNGRHGNLQREIAMGIYQIDGNTKKASHRIEASVKLLREDTPGEQVDGLASLATAFSQVGNHTRARQLLDQVPQGSLGYSLPPKKDPQYDTWLKLLVRADMADPTQRGKRVAFLMRQVAGMMETAGRDSAYQLASPLITEAAMHDAGTGFEIAHALSDKNVIGWSNMIDALLLGTVKRQPDLAMVCGITWCSLVLPYYKQFYSRESQLGEFIGTTVIAASAKEVDILVEMLRAAIETEGQTHERSVLLQRLHLAAQKRGYTSTVLDNALHRWKAESPPARHTNAPMQYDKITNLADLKTAFEQDSEPNGTGYMAVHAFHRLAPDADLEAASDLFEQWQILQDDSRARFLLVDLALKAGRKDYARQLLDDYKASSDEQATWSEWMGGRMRRYFRARLQLDGAGVRSDAHKSFVSSLAAGKESISSVMMEIDKILLVITQTPDWPAIWDLLVEQLSTTREYAIGQPFYVSRTDTNDHEMMAMLFRWAFSLPLSEVRRHARMGALMLTTNPSGKDIFQCLVRMLLNGTGDEPVEALQLVLLDTHETLDRVLREKIASLVDHPDYAVAEAASILSERWKMAVSMSRKELPPFYELILADRNNWTGFQRLTNESSGEKRDEDPMWLFSSIFRNLVDRLARQSVTITHIQHRGRMLIEQWGGLEEFDIEASERLKANLGRMGMRMPFRKPQFTMAAKALRYVAGELRRAPAARIHRPGAQTGDPPHRSRNGAHHLPPLRGNRLCHPTHPGTG